MKPEQEDWLVAGKIQKKSCSLLEFDLRENMNKVEQATATKPFIQLHTNLNRNLSDRYSESLIL